MSKYKTDDSTTDDWKPGDVILLKNGYQGIILVIGNKSNLISHIKFYTIGNPHYMVTDNRIDGCGSSYCKRVIYE